MNPSLLVAAGLFQLTFGTVPAPADAGRGATVEEAVFRDMIRDVPGLMGPYDMPFCLEGPGKSDPPADVMQRLAASDERVRRASACRIETDQEIEPTRWVVERESGKPAVNLHITSIQCSDDRHCWVECGYFARSLSASGNIFEVAKDGQEWVVRSRRMKWIS